MAKFVICRSNGNVAEATFKPQDDDEYNGFYCWELWWISPEPEGQFIGLASLKGLFNFIAAEIAPITDFDA